LCSLEKQSQHADAAGKVATADVFEHPAADHSQPAQTAAADTAATTAAARPADTAGSSDLAANQAAVHADPMGADPTGASRQAAPSQLRFTPQEAIAHLLRRLNRAATALLHRALATKAAPNSTAAAAVDEEAEQCAAETVVVMSCEDWLCRRWDGEATVEELSKQRNPLLLQAGVAFLVSCCDWRLREGRGWPGYGRTDANLLHAEGVRASTPEGAGVEKPSTQTCCSSIAMWKPPSSPATSIACSRTALPPDLQK